MASELRTPPRPLTLCPAGRRLELSKTSPRLGRITQRRLLLRPADRLLLQQLIVPLQGLDPTAQQGVRLLASLAVDAKPAVVEHRDEDCRSLSPEAGQMSTAEYDR